MLKLLFVTLFAWMLFLSSCSSMSISKRGHVQICGKVLAETLNMLCKGEYYDPEDKEDENDIRRNIKLQSGDSQNLLYAIQDLDIALSTDNVYKILKSFQRHTKEFVKIFMENDEINRELYLGFPLRRTHDVDHRPSKQPNDRQQRGVVDECCRQPCSPSVLISYCRANK